MKPEEALRLTIKANPDRCRSRRHLADAYAGGHRATLHWTDDVPFITAEIARGDMIM